MARRSKEADRFFAERKRIEARSLFSAATGLPPAEGKPLNGVPSTRALRRKAEHKHMKDLSKKQRDSDKASAAVVAGLRSEHEAYVASVIEAARAEGLYAD